MRSMAVESSSSWNSVQSTWRARSLTTLASNRRGGSTVAKLTVSSLHASRRACRCRYFARRNARNACSASGW